jgi:hypothetical protein
MARTKTRQRPAPRRAPRPSRKEVKTLIPGHARGTEAYLLMRRRAGRWAVLDSFRGAPAFVGAGEVWQELEPGTPDAEVYRWTESHARALVTRFVEQAVVIARNNRALDAAFEAAETARRLEELAARMVPQQVVPEVVNLQYMGEQLRKAQAEVAARMRRRAPVDKGTSIPAAMDRPGWQPPRPDPAPDRRLLSRKAMEIPANCEDATVGLPVLRVHGPEVTAVLPVVAQYPPKPTEPPTVHLAHLTETHPDTGKRISERVAAAVGAAP